MADCKASSSMAIKVESKLNPHAKEWIPSLARALEEERTLFFIFSVGNPISSFQIWSFFTQKYGNCVEKIVMQPTEEPLFGKVVFKKFTVPALILKGQDEVKLAVDQKSFWCKKYRPRRNE